MDLHLNSVCLCIHKRIAIPQSIKDAYIDVIRSTYPGRRDMTDMAINALLPYLNPDFVSKTSKCTKCIKCKNLKSSNSSTKRRAIETFGKPKKYQDVVCISKQPSAKVLNMQTKIVLKSFYRTFLYYTAFRDAFASIMLDGK